jgi:hypothetical protein
MRLENIIALTHGTLVNKPFVNNFENIVFEIKSLKRGDLFIAFDETLIQEAIFHGAYGVLFDKPTQISDTEIAWIKVDSVSDALKRLLRFRLIEKEVRVYECNEIIIKLALQVITEPHFIALSGNIQEIYKLLWDMEQNSTLLFCPTLTDKDIFTNTKTLSSNVIEPITIMEQTLFETSFIYDNVFYERQLISPFFIPYLEELLHLYKTLKINFRLRKFTPIEHFQAVFTNKKFEIKEFGTSDKVLIFEPNISLIKSEISFLQKQANWAKIVYILPESSYENDESKNTLFYKNKNEILSLLREATFHFALIVGVDKSILSQPISCHRQLTLEF